MNRVQRCSKELHEAMTASGLIKPTSACMVDSVVGRVVEIGDIECLGNKPGLVIETTMEQLRAHGRNLAFCEVEIRLKANATLEPRGKAGQK